MQHIAIFLRLSSEFLDSDFHRATNAPKRILTISPLTVGNPKFM
jgi:hypothetical protein